MPPETNPKDRRSKTEKLIQFPAKSPELHFFQQFDLSNAEVLRQALHFLMRVDQHRQAIKEGQFPDISAGFLLNWIFPIELDMARRENIVDAVPQADQ